MTQKLDIRQHVTDTIIAEIEKGTPPWRQPWTGSKTGAALPLRHNGAPYKGVNVLMLWATAHTRGYSSAQWMTFRQARELGGCVRKGEKGTKSVYYGAIERDDETDGQGEVERIPYLKAYTVFNSDQIDGLPDDFYIRPNPPRDLGTKPDPELDAWFAATGADIISTTEPAAYYRPSTDQIHMPPIETFESAASFYGVLSHESVHWVGGPKRLDRIKRFADKKDVAFEELVAEIGASMLSIHLGVEPQFDQSAAYIETWIEAMSGDKTLIFKAAAEAQKAVDYLTDLANAQADSLAA